MDCLDKEGTILDTGETYVVGLEKLQPGAAKTFEIMTPANPKMARYSYKFVSPTTRLAAVADFRGYFGLPRRQA